MTSPPPTNGPNPGPGPAPACVASLGPVAAAPWGWGRSAAVGLTVYLLSSAVVAGGTAFGQTYLVPRFQTAGPFGPAESGSRFMFRWDAVWYERIARDGYSYDPGRMSRVAFFPLYPLVTRGAAVGGGVPVDVAAIAVSQASLLAALIVAARYASIRAPAAAGLSVAALGFMPNTVFFHLPYTESLFLLLAVAFCLGIARNWHPGYLAVLAGLASASRPVGVAFAPLLFAYAVRRAGRAGGRGRALAAGCAYGAMALGGLLVYMGYQYATFGTPLAFAQTQTHWRYGAEEPFAEKLIALESLEPFWTVLDSESPKYWRRFPPDHATAFGPLVFDRVFFCIAVAGLIVGRVARWLNGYETVLVAELLLIPYLTRGHEMCLFSSARFVSVAVPLYLVYGTALSRVPAWAAHGLAGVGGFFLGAYAAVFVAGYLLI